MANVAVICEKLLLLIREKNHNELDSLFKYGQFFQSAGDICNLLHYSVSIGIKEVTNFLLNQCCKVNAHDHTGNTPLIVALKGHENKIITMLLAAGADITVLNNENKSALHIVCEDHKLTSDILQNVLHQLPKKYFSSEKIAQKLIDVGCHLYQAAYLNNTEVLEYMIKQGLPVVSAHPVSQETALHVALKFENVNSVKVLLKYGADVNALDSNGENSLFYLYKYNKRHTPNKLELLQILTNLEVSITSYTLHGLFQAGLVFKDGNSEAICILLQRNIDFSAKDNIIGENVLHYLAFNTNSGVTEVLKPHAHKFDVNVIDDRGRNPLYIAVTRANVAMVEFLLSEGIRPDCEDKLNGYTPIYNAFLQYKPEFELEISQCIELLLQYDADPQIVIGTKRNGEPITIFDIATKTNSLNCLKPVIAHLGMLERQGRPIINGIYTFINSCQPLKKYFSNCRTLLRKKIFKLTLFKLLSADKKQMACYARNGKLVQKLKRLGNKPNLKSLYSYYYRMLEKRLSEGILFRRFMDEVAGVICKIFNDRLGRRHLIIDEIIRFLNNHSLQILYQLSKEIQK